MLWKKHQELEQLDESSEKYVAELDLGDHRTERVVKLTWLPDPEKQIHQVARVFGRSSKALERDID